MENAVEAIKMAGFLLIFTIALAVAMFTIMKSKRATEDVIKYSDKTRLRSNIELDIADTTPNRVISVNDIIPTLYRYKQENYIVLFYNNSNNAIPILNSSSSSSSFGSIKQIGTRSKYVLFKFSYR